MFIVRADYEFSPDIMLFAHVCSFEENVWLHYSAGQLHNSKNGKKRQQRESFTRESMTRFC